MTKLYLTVIIALVLIAAPASVNAGDLLEDLGGEVAERAIDFGDDYARHKVEERADEREQKRDAKLELLSAQYKRAKKEIAAHRNRVLELENIKLDTASAKKVKRIDAIIERRRKEIRRLEAKLASIEKQAAKL